MANKIWLKNYPVAIPAEIDADQFMSIPDLLEKIAVKFSAKPAYHNLGYTLSYATLERLSRNFAACLQGLPGYGQGRARCHHGAEPAAIPGGAVRHPTRRHDRGERQSAVHAT